MKTIKLLFGVFTLIFASLSNAAIITYGTYTHDTTTDIVVGDGLEWLQWDRTTNQSIASIQSQLDTIEGGGWSIASSAQMNPLFNNFFGFGGTVWDTDENTGQSTNNIGSINTISPFNIFTLMFGVTQTLVPPDYSKYAIRTTAFYGQVPNTQGWYPEASVYYEILLNSHQTWEWAELWCCEVGTEQKSNNVGIVLVRNTSVPEPSIIALFAAGLVGIGLARRRRFIKKKIYTFLALFLLWVTRPVSAIPTTYIYDTDNQITGISGLVVNGDIWDMKLHDGSFDVLLDSNQPSPIYNELFGLRASLALSDFINSLAGSTQSPMDFLGCTNDHSCLIITVVDDCTPQFSAQDNCGHASFVWDDRPSYVDSGLYRLHQGQPNRDFTTFATWEEFMSVPEPPIVLLFTAGLVGLIGAARSKVKV